MPATDQDLEGFMRDDETEQDYRDALAAIKEDVLRLRSLLD